MKIWMIHHGKKAKHRVALLTQEEVDLARALAQEGNFLKAKKAKKTRRAKR